MPPSRVDRSAAIVLFVAVCAAYFNVFLGEIQAGDRSLLADPAVATLGGWLAAQPAPRPLLTLSYALTNAAGLGAAGWRAANVALHAIAVLFAYAVLRRLTHRDDIVFRDQRLAAFITAAVFALHPAQADAVALLSGRAASLAAVFALLSMLLWLRGREYDDPRDLYLRSPLAFVAALACNEATIVLPLALLLAARLQSHRGWWVRIAVRESSLHWLLALIAIGVAIALPGHAGFTPGVFGAQDVANDLVARADAVARLAGQLAQPQRLSGEPVLVQPSPAQLAAAAAVVASLVAALASLRRYPVLAFAILWFLLWLAPSILFGAQGEIARERDLYLALIGPILGTARLVLRLSPRLLQWALVPVLLAGLAFATHQRNRALADEVAGASERVAWAAQDRYEPSDRGPAIWCPMRAPADPERPADCAYAVPPGG